MSLTIHRGSAAHAPNRAGILRVLRTVRDGGKLEAYHLPTLEAMTEAVHHGWLEVLNDRRPVEQWRYRLTTEGRKQAGPALRLIVGGLR
ncbi:hypothetical protein [Metallibacterium sp.]